MRKLIHSCYQNTHRTSLSSMIEDICVVFTETGVTRLHLRKAKLKMRHNCLIIINRGKYILTNAVASVQKLDTDVYFATSKSQMTFILVALLGKFQQCVLAGGHSTTHLSRLRRWLPSVQGKQAPAAFCCGSLVSPGTN